MYRRFISVPLNDTSSCSPAVLVSDGEINALQQLDDGLTSFNVQTCLSGCLHGNFVSVAPHDNTVYQCTNMFNG